MRQPTVVVQPAARNHGSRMVMLAAVLLGCNDPVGPLTGELTYLGLEGESITALAETPWGLFAGTRNGGVYRYQPDSANQWKALGLSHAVVSAILFVPGATPRLLVGMRPRADETTAAAVFASEDKGERWIPWDGGLAAQHGNQQWAFSLAVDPGDSRRLFMGQSLPVLRSTDGGVSWAYVVGRPDYRGMGVSTIAVSPNRDGHVYAGAESAFFTAVVYRSRDSGDTWEFVDPTPGFENAVLSLVVDPNKPSRLLIGMYGGVMRSEDFGQTWQAVLKRPGFLVRSLLSTSNSLYAVGGTISDSPDLVTPPLTVYRSTDGGTTWSAIMTTPNPGGSDVATMDSQGRLLIGTTSRSRGGLWRMDPR